MTLISQPPTHVKALICQPVTQEPIGIDLPALCGEKKKEEKKSDHLHCSCHILDIALYDSFTDQTFIVLNLVKACLTDV